MDKPTMDGMPEELRTLKSEVFQMKGMLQTLLQREQQRVNEETWLTTKEAEKVTGLKQQTIRTKIMQDLIPSHKIQGRRMMLKSELLDWMSKNGKR